MSPILSLRHLRVTYPSEAGPVHAVRGLSLDLEPGRTMALVGESGAGKSAAALAVLGLHPASTTVTGSIRLGGRELLGLNDAAWSALRGRELAIIFQDALSALTPVYSVGHQIAEAIVAHGGADKAVAWDRAVEVLGLVGIARPSDCARSFPFQLSGGMRQRVMIALAVANDPAVIVADEPTTALDVTIQAQVLQVLRRAQAETGAALLLVTHDLGVVAGIADDVTVMYAGRAVERGPVADLFAAPAMPYTIGLVGAAPRPDQDGRGALPGVEGSPPSLVDLSPGCLFEPRCPLADAVCRQEEPALRPVPGGPQPRIAGGPTLEPALRPVPGGPLEAEPAVEPQPSATRRWAACHRLAEIDRVRRGAADLFPVPPGPGRSPPSGEPATVLEVSGLRKDYPVHQRGRHRAGAVRAVDGVELALRAGETLGLVGESGAGKSTILLQILELGRPQRGTITVLGHDTAALGRRARRDLRREIQVVFQDSVAALDPRLPVFDLVAEPLSAFRCPRSEIPGRVFDLLRLVGLGPDHADRFARQLSGGQRQRVGIARALALQPQILLLDEPVSALDVSVQAGIINLLVSLQDEFGLAYLLVAHDLAVVRHLCDRVAVLYLGRVVEEGDVASVYERPLHPYTQALIAAAPIPDPAVERGRQPVSLSGDGTEPGPVWPGCSFAPRCPRFAAAVVEDRSRCQRERPSLTGLGHRVACHVSPPGGEAAVAGE